MGKLNTAQALREYIDLSASIIEPCIEDIYISKRILTDEGHSPDEVDDFISERISHYDGYYQGLDEDAYNECVVKEKERVLANLAKPIEERIAIDPDHLPDSDEISIENIRKIAKNIRHEARYGEHGSRRRRYRLCDNGLRERVRRALRSNARGRTRSADVQQNAGVTLR